MRAYVITTSLLLVLVVFFGKSLAGDEVNNGGGTSEGNFATAYLNLDRYIDLCLDLPSCTLTKEERQILDAIKQALPQERATEKQLIFLSESKHPGTFIINGEMKIAKTGDEIGSKIFINKDMLYFKNPRTKLTEGLSLQKTVQILVHELGHHHNIEDHLFLDLLGAKVSMNLTRNMITAKLLAESEGIKAVVINGKNEDEFPQVLLYIFDTIVDATEKFQKALNCQSLGLPIPVNLPRDVVISFSKPSGALYHNIFWHKYKFGTIINKKKGKLVLRGHLTKTCGKAPNFIFNNKKYKGDIKFKIKRKEDEKGRHKWEYVNNSLRVEEDYDPWWKIIRIPFLTD